MSKAIIQYYVEPNTPVTNQVIGQWFDDSGVEKDYGTFTCADGEKRKLWRCDDKLVAMLQGKKYELNFTFWVQKDSGPIHQPVIASPKMRNRLVPARTIPKPTKKFRVPVDAKPPAGK